MNSATVHLTLQVHSFDVSSNIFQVHSFSNFLDTLHFPWGQVKCLAKGDGWISQTANNQLNIFSPSNGILYYVLDYKWRNWLPFKKIIKMQIKTNRNF